MFSPERLLDAYHQIHICICVAKMVFQFALSNKRGSKLSISCFPYEKKKQDSSECGTEKKKKTVNQCLVVVCTLFSLSGLLLFKGMHLLLMSMFFPGWPLIIWIFISTGISIVNLLYSEHTVTFRGIDKLLILSEF